MEAEKEDDPFASVIRFCRPTASQEATFSNCPLARESEKFVDSYQDHVTSSPDPTPSEPTRIVMVSPPGSSSSVQQHVEEEAVFHTPPEHHAHSHLSSEEDQNPNDLCAEGFGPVDGPDRRNKVRVSEAGLDGEPQAKKRVTEEKFVGETVPVDETEVIIMDSKDSDDEICTVNLAEDSLDITNGGLKVKVVQKVDELKKDGVPRVLAVNGNVELGRNCTSLEGSRVNKGEKSCEYSDMSKSLDSGKMDEEIDVLKHIVGNRSIEVEQTSGVGGSEKVVKITQHAKMPKDCHRNGGLEIDGERIQEICLKTDDERIEVIVRETNRNRVEKIGIETDGKRTEEIGLETNDKRAEEVGLETNGTRSEENGKRIQDIDEFGYTCADDRNWKGRRRQLPVSLKGKEIEVVESAKTELGLLDFLDVVTAVVGDREGGCEGTDFLETAKSRGLTFPKPRWWASEGDDERQDS